MIYLIKTFNNTFYKKIKITKYKNSMKYISLGDINLSMLPEKNNILLKLVHILLQRLPC